MPANPSELKNFFWHCLVAARLQDEFPETTVTRSHVLHAIRKATDCWAGRNGVQLASDDARAQMDRMGTHWEKCGLRKEHVIPVKIVNGFVREAMQASTAVGTPTEPPVLPDPHMQGLTPEVVALFRQHPRAWTVAQVIREWTLHAWITADEDQKFDDKDKHGFSIRHRMPAGWTRDQDRLQRYHDCGINVSSI